jgi:hypothetical protein
MYICIYGKAARLVKLLLVKPPGALSKAAASKAARRAYWRFYCCFTAALLLLYCCFTAALLLLYCCFTAALLRGGALNDALIEPY